MIENKIRKTIKKGYEMNISAISDNDSRRNLFIEYANKFMSFKSNQEENPEAAVTNPVNQEKKPEKSMGIETLTIFPKQVIDGKTIIIA